MTSRSYLQAFGARRGWRRISYADLGTTAHVAIVGTGDQRLALAHRLEGQPTGTDLVQEGLDAIGRTHFERQLRAL